MSETSRSGAGRRGIVLGGIGRGGRGEWLAGFFGENGGLFKLVSIANYFAERVEPTGDKHGVEAKRMFAGSSCQQKMVEAGGWNA